VEASTVTVVPEAQAPHGEIPVSSEAGHGEEAVSAPVQGDGFDQHACDGAAGGQQTESKRASLTCAHAPSLGWEAQRSPEGSRKDFERSDESTPGYSSGVKR